MPSNFAFPFPAGSSPPVGNGYAVPHAGTVLFALGTGSWHPRGFHLGRLGNFPFSVRRCPQFSRRGRDWLPTRDGIQSAPRELRPRGVPGRESVPDADLIGTGERRMDGRGVHSKKFSQVSNERRTFRRLVRYPDRHGFRVGHFFWGGDTPGPFSRLSPCARISRLPILGKTAFSATFHFSPFSFHCAPRTHHSSPFSQRKCPPYSFPQAAHRLNPAASSARPSRRSTSAPSLPRPITSAT